MERKGRHYLVWYRNYLEQREMPALIARRELKGIVDTVEAVTMKG